MLFDKIRKNFLFLLLLFILSTKFLFGTEYPTVIEKYFSDRKLESIEGIWKKTLANQGPAGCITVFFKTEQGLFHQIHIDSCFVMNKVTGKHKKESNIEYKGQNAVYFYNGDVNWGSSSIMISENYDAFSITHESYNNIFREEWKRVWPKDIKSYNKSLSDNN